MYLTTLLDPRRLHTTARRTLSCWSVSAEKNKTIITIIKKVFLLCYERLSFLTVSFSHQNKLKEKVFYGFVVCYRSCVSMNFSNRPMIFEITIKCQLPLRNSSALLRCFSRSASYSDITKIWNPHKLQRWVHIVTYLGPMLLRLKPQLAEPRPVGFTWKETFMLIKILTLCKFSMSFSWFLNSVKVGLASGSFFQHFIMIWYLELFKWSVRDLNNVSQYNKRERFEKENLQVFIYMLWFRHPVSILK